MSADPWLGVLTRPERWLDVPLAGVLGAFRTHFPCSRRTHARLPVKRLRTIHRLASANSVCNCAVFLARPR